MANANANLGSTSDSGMTIPCARTRKYSATPGFTIQTAGNEKAIGIPHCRSVARSGAVATRRIQNCRCFSLIYLIMTIAST
jgi:hypothetical protein